MNCYRVTNLLLLLKIRPFYEEFIVQPYITYMAIPQPSLSIPPAGVCVQFSETRQPFGGPAKHTYI